MIRMEEIKEWTVQMLDTNGSIKYQSSITGTEKQAKSLLRKFEDKYRSEKYA